MSILKNGFFKVTRAENGELLVVTKGGNAETLNASETFKSWDAVLTNIRAAIRAAQGRFGIVVDATLENLSRKKIYYHLKAEGEPKIVNVQDATTEEIMAKVVDAPDGGIKDYFVEPAATNSEANTNTGGTGTPGGF